jgi:hypothetical protein
LHQEVRRRFDNVWTSHNDSVRTSHLFFYSGRPSSRKDRIPQTVGGLTVRPICESVCPDVPRPQTFQRLTFSWQPEQGLKTGNTA